MSCPFRCAHSVLFVIFTRAPKPHVSRGRVPRLDTFSHLPSSVFLLQITATLFNLTSMENMRRMLHNIFAMMNLMNPEPLQDSITLEFKDVERKKIFQSAMTNVDKYWNRESEVWLKPLRVNFKGEYAIDLGGPSKEFFHLLFEELMDPCKLKFFKRIDERSISSDLWFNADCKDLQTLEKIGLLFGLLIYNETFIRVPFPVLLHDKLLTGKSLQVDDLMCLDAELSQQLLDLKAYSPQELEEKKVCFQGLHPDGDNIYVTEDNLEEYIDRRTMTSLAKDQFDAFHQGFNRILSSTHLQKLFTASEEMRKVILGGEFNWGLFQKGTRYVEPYDENHPTITLFWKAFHALGADDKRRFLKFLTGTDHVPIEGFKSLKFTIRKMDTVWKYRAEPGEICPEVMTCPGFISLDLPEYEKEEDLHFRLLMAMECTGFHRETPHTPWFFPG